MCRIKKLLFVSFFVTILMFPMGSSLMAQEMMNSNVEMEQVMTSEEEYEVRENNECCYRECCPRRCVRERCYRECCPRRCVHKCCYRECCPRRCVRECCPRCRSCCRRCCCFDPIGGVVNIATAPIRLIGSAFCCW